MYVHYAAESVHRNTGKHALDDRAVCTNSSVFTPETDSVLVNLSNNITIELSCKKCHSNLVLEEPANIAYLYDLAEQNPLTYTKLALLRKKSVGNSTIK